MSEQDCRTAVHGESERGNTESERSQPIDPVKLVGGAVALSMAVPMIAYASSPSDSAAATSEIVEPTKVSQQGEPMTQEEVDYYMAKYLANLTFERTGHPLNYATVERIRTFAEEDDGQPFFMINLVRERSEVYYPDTWKGERASTVLEAKKMYSAACSPIMGASGSFSVTGVTFTDPAVLTDDESMEDWDQFYLISYQNRKAFMELLCSDAYADAIVHKYAGDEATQLIPVSANEMTFKGLFEDSVPMSQQQVDKYMETYINNLTFERTGHHLNYATVARIRAFAEADEGKPFYMINLVRERSSVVYPETWTGPRGATVLEAKKQYSLACYPIMGASGTYSTTGVMIASPFVLTDDETAADWNQFYLIAYPNREAFMKLLCSDAYADAIVHKYAGDAATQLIPVTANELKIKTSAK